MSLLWPAEALQSHSRSWGGDMSITVQQLGRLMAQCENEQLEFKEGKNRYDFEELVKYCAALANEGGGTFILGVTNKFPREVVGTKAFRNLERTKAGLVGRLHIRIDAHEISHPHGRVVVFEVPARHLGLPVHYKGAYWMRSGESLVPMTADRLKRIFEEAGPDFSAEICRQATIEDLDPAGVETFRTLWRRKSGNAALDNKPCGELLRDAELIIDDDVTYAALALLASREALAKFLPQAELVFEYRSDEVSGPAQQRREYRQGFFLFYDDLWELINLRNDVQHFREGFFVFDIPTFRETVIREAVLNAVSHRDYRLAPSIFVRQYPRKMEIVSPGGFPPGITEENILWRQAPRNRRIADVLAKSGFVERSGQGMNLMFEGSIKDGKARPDFAGTDDFQVSVTLTGDVQDPRFLQFLERVGHETLASFTTRDLLVLDCVNCEQPIPEDLHPRVALLLDQGIIERVGRGRGVRYVLSRRFYGFLGKRGAYTRKRGLDRETNKQLLLRHIGDNAEDGSPLRDLLQVQPALTMGHVQSLLRELRREGHIRCVGRTRAARWYPVPDPKHITPEEKQ